MEMVSPALQGTKPSLKQIVLNRLLTTDAKRLIFISGLYGWLHREDDKYELLRGLADVNERLDLADNVSSLVYPAMNWKKCWGHLDIPEHLLEHEDLESLVRRILSSAPWWLEYSNKADLSQDIKKMLARKVTMAEKKVVSIY